jgi:hypothetical protein
MNNTTAPPFQCCTCSCGCSLPLHTAKEFKLGRCRWCWQGEDDAELPAEDPVSLAA